MSEPAAPFECRSSVEKVRVGGDPFIRRRQTLRGEASRFSLVGFVNHRPAARKPPLGRNLDGFRKDVMTRYSSCPLPNERHRKPRRDAVKAERPRPGIGSTTSTPGFVTVWPDSYWRSTTHFRTHHCGRSAQALLKQSKSFIRWEQTRSKLPHFG